MAIIMAISVTCPLSSMASGCLLNDSATYLRITITANTSTTSTTTGTASSSATTSTTSTTTTTSTSTTTTSTTTVACAYLTSLLNCHASSDRAVTTAPG